MKIQRNRRWLIAGLVAFVACIATLAFTPRAEAHPQMSSDGKVCIVNRNEWDTNVNYSNALTLRSALYYAKKGWGCTTIVLDSDVQLTGPMEIALDNIVVTGAGIPDGQPNFLEGGNMPNLNQGAGEQHFISGQLGITEGSCAITIVSSGVTMEHLKIQSVYDSGTAPSETQLDGGEAPTLSDESGTKRKGLCINGSHNIIRDVDLLNIAGDGFFFGANSNGNVIEPDSSAIGVGGYGVRDMTNSLTQLNALKPTDGTLSQEIDGDGLYQITDLAAANKFTVDTQVEGGLLASEKDAQLKVTSISLRGNATDGEYVLDGALVKGAALGDIDCEQTLNVVPDMQQIAIFKYTDQGGSKVIQFVGLAGVSYAAGVLQNRPGWFKIIIDKDPTKDHPEFADANILILVPLNAEYQIIGKASRPITLQPNADTDCVGDTGATSGSGIFGHEGISSWNRFNSVPSCTSELGGQAQEIDPTWDSDMDLILDYIEMGIRKVVESNGDVKWVFRPEAVSCTCTDTLSCWYKTDTDTDGVIDYFESPKLNYADLHRAWEEDDCDSTPSDPGTRPCPPGIYRYTGGAINDAAWDVTELVVESDQLANQKKDPNVQDSDSDDDGLEDGFENRNRLFQPGVKSYFYYLEGLNNALYLDSNDQPVECDLNDAIWGLDRGPSRAAAHMIGVAWNLFIAGGKYGQKIDKPIQFEMGTDYSDAQFPEGARLLAMACRNGTVAGPQNFNLVEPGSPDPGETDPTDADTDDDCVCDGPGGYGRDACQILDDAVGSHPLAKDCLAVHNNQNIETRKDLWYTDACPNKAYPTRECVRECIPGEITTTTAYVLMLNHNIDVNEYMDIVWGDEDHRTVLSARFLVDASNMPLLFNKQTVDEYGNTVLDTQFVQQACGDVDGDGVPSCVERWDDSTCWAQHADREWLDPYNPDTDGDGLIDGQGGGENSDVCPFDRAEGGQDDKFTPVNPNYSCDPYLEVYTYLKAGGTHILAYFLDRDQDGLVDAIEDKNHDGAIVSMEGVGNIFKTETDPLSRDTDGDSLKDKFELDGWPISTNPADIDTDGDNWSDPEEDADCRQPGVVCTENDYYINVTIGNDGTCAAARTSDTDPTLADTDGDGLNDKIETEGSLTDDTQFLAQLNALGLAAFLTTNYADPVSDPTAVDSDNDGLNDSAEYNGVLEYNSSNPCMKDSDADSVFDDNDPCPLNSDTSCTAADIAFGADTDADGLADEREIALGTDPRNKDSDGDGVFDGEEDANRNGIYEDWLGESNPLVADTDGDGLSDGYERRYGTDPTNNDTDGDCIPDGVEDANQNGIWDPSETNAMSSDSDGDMLPDGWLNGLGEDRNCNGFVDTDAEGRRIETDPRMPDTDLDGMLDYDEMLDGGYFNINNIGQATTGHSGCSLSAGTVPTSGSGLVAVMMGFALMAIVRVRRSLRLRKGRV